MRRFCNLISEVIRVGGDEAKAILPKIENPLMQKDEAEILDYIRDYYKKYGCAPTVDAFKDQYAIYYTEAWKGTPLQHLTELYYKDIRNGEFLRISGDLEEKVGSGVAFDAEQFIKRFNSLPSFTPVVVRDMLDEFDDDSLYDGVTPNSGFNLGLRAYQDDEIGSLTAGRIFGLMAHKKSGKTTVTSILGTKAFIEHRKVLYLTYEMPVDAIKKKVHACLGKFDTKLFRAELGSEQHTELTNKKLAVKSQLQYHTGCGGKLVVQRGVSMGQIRDILLREQKETSKAFDLVIIDGFYLVPAGSGEDDKWKGVEHNIEALRQMVMGDEELKPFACLFSSQLSPSSAGKGVAIDSTDIAKSRALAETADVILAMVADKDNVPDGRIITVLENRDGASGLGCKAEINLNFEQTMIQVNNRTGFASPVSAGTYTNLFDIKAFSVRKRDADEEAEELEEAKLLTNGDGYLVDGNGEEFITEEMFDGGYDSVADLIEAGITSPEVEYDLDGENDTQ